MEVKNEKIIASILALTTAAALFTGCSDTEVKENTLETNDISENSEIQTTKNTITTPVTSTTAVTQTTTSVSSVTTTSVTTTTENESLNSVQENSIAWLNYLAMLTQEINNSKNSKLFLEEAYASLINNTDPENVNELTESHL